ncbi:PREDICTED: uncharacterized protein LOC105557926 [Vollenhovia emeryi]|uniref:uncharacterized protein LOC105557926 n=1 Tax=Vollenhovia emeryi TaxID=411798 RepID=UPI0005F43CF8|nr:PREDICTED: uncharacterized protein LOC105557926 [Vollenhovia emeryi]
MVIRHYHEKLFHTGAHTTLNTIRQEFWPIFGKSRTKKLIRNCVICRKANPKPAQQLMGQLPKARVTPSRFLQHGVDYCGPFFVRDRVRRNSKRYKAYVAIFVCMATKAVHIELVEDMTTESFIAAFKRFISRRGLVSNMYSNNGKNFVGADREFRSFLKSDEYKSFSFIPPRALHFGGLWESAVRSMKQHLKRTVGDASLTVAEMTTVLAQVEAILNSRPITPMSEDPNDLEALTPGHFIIGTSLRTHPEEDLREVKLTRLSRWQHVEQIRQHFWSRWHRDYLTTCQQRSKWKSETPIEWKIGQLVMLKEDSAMPLKWTLSRITEVHPGSDEVVRTITARNNKGTCKRAVVNVSPVIDCVIRYMFV